MLDFGEYIESLLAVLVSLRIFEFEADTECPMGDGLAFITKVSDRAPRLEYFVILHTGYRYWRRVDGQWVIRDESEFPVHALF